MAIPAKIKAVSAAAVFLALTASAAYCAELAELTSQLDRAQWPAEFARVAARLEIMASPGEDGGLIVPEGALTQLARADYLIGEAECDKKKRLAFFNKSIAASDRALAGSPDDIRALYWRSMACLQKADIVGGISALGLVKHALKAFEEVAAKDPAYDRAGALRSHGKVLMEAPAWAFVGDRVKGVALLERAKSIDPASLLNRLYLADAYAETGREPEARTELMFIMSAPLDSLKPMDDEKVKKDAARLLDKLGG
jgi:tetratricopeptide (TPR) repeat protein